MKRKKYGKRYYKKRGKKKRYHRRKPLKSYGSSRGGIRL